MAPKKTGQAGKPFYRGQPVVRMERSRNDSILLTFPNSAETKGQPRPRLVVTQQEWDEHGQFLSVQDS